MGDTERAEESREPRRLLIVSANMGEGHNATGKALEAAARRVWPGAEIRWVDVLDAMGPGTGPLFRWIYRTAVERLPGWYEFFYASVWHHRAFARAAKRVIGAWSGRRLAPVLDDVEPDLVLSTYPMGSTGLEWLRRHRGLAVRTGAWVSDFAPHPSWVHTGVDLNLVVHDVAVGPARASVPGAPVAVTAPPVAGDFRPGDRAHARAGLGLPGTATLAVVACGSLGFGRAGETVRELLDGDPGQYVVVVAGRNAALEAGLRREFSHTERVIVCGWVDDMASLFVAADVVVTNAGGATSLEALACGRAVLMHNPIAGHGNANARLMAEAGLARVCTRAGELSAAVRSFREDPERLRAMEQAALRYAGSHRIEDGLRRLARSTAWQGERPLHPPDALFLHVDTAAAPQQVGTVLVFEPGPELTPEHGAGMLAAVPGIGGTLRGAGPLRRARWTPAGRADPRTLVDEVSADDLGAAVDEFFSEPLAYRRAVGAARLVTGLPDGRRALLVKLHHALGDGVTVLQALLSDTDADAGLSWAGRPSIPLRGNGFSVPPRKLLRGLWALARAGRAPAVPALDGRTSGPARHHELFLLRGREVRARARALGVSPAELLQAVFAEAVHDVLPSTGFRLMVPWSLRGTESLRSAGNHTGAVSVDLPVGEVPPARRAELMGQAMRAKVEAGVPEAAHAVVRLLGALPPPLHAVAARAVYRRAWFNGIGTVLPGPRREVRWHGSVMSAAYPVLPLGPGTGLAWGAMTWGPWITVCLTGRPAGAALVEQLAKRMDTAFASLAGPGTE